MGGQQRISGRRRGRRCQVSWANEGGEYDIGELWSSGFPKMEGKVILGEEEVSVPRFKLFKYYFGYYFL